MKKLLLVALLLAFTSHAEAGQHKKMASIPLPRPIPVEKIAGIKGDLLPPPMFVAQNPDPFKTQPQPGTTVQVPNPPAGSPINVHIPSTATENFIQYIWMFIVAGVGAMIGIPQLKQAFSAYPLHLDPAHPDVKKAILESVIQVIQSGALQQPVQAKLSSIPTVGPFLAMLEPEAKQLLLKYLQSDPAAQPAPPPSPPPAPTSTTLSPELLKQIIDAVETRLKGPTP